MFDDLEDAADTLGDLGMGMSWAQQQKKQLKLAKRYLKGDFKVTWMTDIGCGHIWATNYS